MSEVHVNDDDVEEEQLELGATSSVEVLAASWGDELRQIVKRLDHAVETFRPQLNNLIHHIERHEEVP